MNRHRFLCTAAALAVAGTWSGANAQTVGTDTPAELTNVTEIVVTAQKRSERLIDVPISVSVISAEEIERGGIRNLNDASRLAPNFQIETGRTSNDVRLSARGISAAAEVTGQPESVGIFVDNVYFSARNIANLNFANIERVEVLRGPQDTLFGRNTSAGAINIVTRAPTNEFSVRAQGEYGNYNNVRLQGGVSGPVIRDTLYFSASGSFADQDGYQNNEITGISQQGQKSYSGRGTLRLRPADSGFDITLTGDYYKDDNLSGVLDSSPFDREITSDIPSTDSLELYSASLNASYDFGPVTLTSITSYVAFEQSIFLTVNTTPQAPGQRSNTQEFEDRKTFAQEFRLSSNGQQRLTYIAGFYYFNEDLERQSDLTLTTIVPGPSVPMAPPFIITQGTVFRPFSQDSESWAVFGQARYELTERFSALVGARYTQDKKTVVTETTGSIFPILGPSPRLSQSGNDNAFTFKGVLQYQLGADAQAYASYSQGYKEGTFNPLSLAGTPFEDLQEVKPERSTNYEVGFKANLLDRALALNVAAFYIDYRDLQVFFNDSATLTTVLTNAPKTRSVGFEFEAIAQMSADFRANVSIGYADATYVDFPGCARGGTNCDGNRTVYAPDVSANAGFVWSPSLSDALQLQIGSDVALRGATFFDVTNDQNSRRAPYATVNGSIGVSTVDGRWSISAFARNVFDEDYFVGYRDPNPIIFGTPFAPSYIPAAPRTFGVRVGVAF
jgi:iron complex outermembrane recepter protein